MKRLTVVQTLPALNMGGVERGTLEVARALVEAGHRSIVIAGEGHLSKQLTAEGSEHINWPIGRKSPLTLRFIPTLRRLLIDERVDILHSRSRLPAWISYLAWRNLPAGSPTRFVTTMHGAHSVSRYSRIMTRGEQVIAVSEFMRDHILENYPDTDPRRIVVIPRGIDPAFFPHGYQPPADWLGEWQQQQPQLRGKQVITLPARLTRRKGHEDFIEIIKRLRQKNMNVHGLIVGGRDPRRRAYADTIEKRIRQAELENHISLLGHRNDLREIMAVSNIVLVLSRQPESFGRTALEALSLGTPVVGYAHGGTAEILQRLYPAGALEPGDWQQATEVIQACLQQQQALKPVTQYSLASMLDATLNLYKACSNAWPGNKSDHE